MMHRFHAGRPESRSSACGEKDAILRMDYLKRRTRTGIRSSRRSICSRGSVVYDTTIYATISVANPHGSEIGATGRSPCGASYASPVTTHYFFLQSSICHCDLDAFAISAVIRSAGTGSV